MDAFYRSYLNRCNEHRFEDLGEFVADDVQVNRVATGFDQYIAGLRAIVDAFLTTTGTSNTSWSTATGSPPT